MKTLRVNRTKTQLLRWSLALFSLLMVLSLLLAAPGGAALAGGAAAQAQDGTVLPEAPDAITAAYTYSVAPAGNITDTGTIPDNACGATGWPNTRYFLVNDHFNVTDLNVRFTATHDERGNIQVILTSPPDASGSTATATIVATSADDDNNYDILLDADTGSALDDNNPDNTADPVDRTVLQTLLNNFESRDARGAWRMDICDNNSGTTGTLVGATLNFTGDPITPPAPVFSQGPAVLETYYIPFPESQLWTAMGTLYYPGRAAATGDTSSATSCTDYSSFNSNPRQPIIGYIGVTIVEANTQVYYDHWEDGYEAALSFPTQSTTEVWGDGVLTNGRAPADADDVLTAGQIVILNDVKDSTAAEIVDYDARDKLAASAPVAVTRSAWSNGSTTLYASADEVYPTTMWGTDYRLPVGEFGGTAFDYFQYTGVSVMAAVDGTTVSIDRDNNGTAEMTCSLNQGEACQWDDKSDATGIMGVNNVIGNGLITGSRITSNANHPIQVSLMTGDVCAGYETRSYTLLPTTSWSNQYYAPVSSNAAGRTIGSNTAYDPAVVHLYNPGTSPLTVNWTFGTGATGSQTLPANTFQSVQMPDTSADGSSSGGTGARFYSTGNFYAISTVDANGGNGGNDYDGAANDWGYTLVPVSSMSQYLIAGWAPGFDPNIPSATEDSAPIWLTGGHTATPTSTTAFTVCIDEGGNGGSNTDPVTGRTYDRTISLTPFQQQIVYDTRTGVYGETGMQLWVCDATNGSDAVITAAWGEDPDVVTSFGKPTMDMGFTIRNLRAWTATKGVALQNDLNGNGLYDEGDTLRFTITVTNKGTQIPANTLNVKDDLPAKVTYLLNSTNVIWNDNTTHAIADGATTPFPLDESGYTYNQVLPAGGKFKVYFDATLNPGASDAPATVTNIAHVADSTLTVNPEATITVQKPSASIGNYVWLDEDGDGDQDAGEAGIPNMKVELCADAACSTVLKTTYTDANGGYLFTGLPAGTYYVRTTPAAGLNPTFDENGTGTPNITTVTVTAGQEYLTADFGYNWSTPTETNNPTTGSTGAIGDRVWVDVDPDGAGPLLPNGLQDPEEVGFQGVSVQLWYDSNNDGVIDAQYGASVTTDANGSYLFDNLPAGIYEVRIPTPPAGYTQTGDPDSFGENCASACDNKTTTPIVLGPGDIFVDADFGYTPTGANVGAIGDTLWLDADRAGDVDAGEPRLPGVTVSLIKDSNGNGVWDAGEPVIATDVTDANGQYLFSGLPANGTEDYLVWVNDTNNVLGGLVPVYDSDGTGTKNISAVANLTNVGNLNQDFGYAPLHQDAGDGLIGDTIFLDRDGSGTVGAGEGLEGIRVRLYASDGTTLLATTVTNENGQYFFGNLNPTATYVVKVDTATLPYTGLTNTVDPDGGTANQSTVNLALTGPVNLAQDFGYRDTTNPNTISGTIWKDSDANGSLTGGETGRFAGVTVVLLDGNGNVVATTSTDANGDYSFANLPDGTFKVDVTDDNNVLNGYWKSTGPSAGSDNNSQLDPYTVSVSGGQTNTTADFGYYQQPAALGNYVWEDLDGDGVQDAGEPGIPGVPVTLTITWPNSAGTTILKTTTDASGFYSFANLLQDEDYPASGGAGQPTLSVAISTPAGYANSPQNQTTEDLDSDNPAGEPAAATKGSANNIYDFGLVRYGAIGNYVWLDEDGDGDQDAGEAGIPNATVQLCADAACTTVLKTTTTDANGGYLFTDVPRGSYYVKVTPPAGLNPTFDENGGLDNVSTVTLTSSGQEYLTADFGYNWSTPTETNNPGPSSNNTGAIGDRVWIDADGDGKQDPEEIGMEGIPVSLYCDLNANGVIDASDVPACATTTTDANGNYVFDNLPAGIYQVLVNGGTEPLGYDQTGDPDAFGMLCSTCDNRSSVDLVLGPGDVMLNLDFGYKPETTAGSIGDTVWLDANVNGVRDGSEWAIPGVTVSLIKDSNGNGTWDPGEPVIATDVTDASGHYLFSGLPANGTEDYLVWVNDTNNVLGGLVPTFDSNGTGTPNISSVANLTNVGNLNQDFGYAPSGHDSGEGLIGDTIFLDRDGSGTVGAGEGLEGIRVRLYASDGTTLLATTVTNENGQYFFGNLNPTATYVVKVDTTTLPTGVDNTVDPDGGTTNQSTVNLAVTGPVNLAQDFGYRDTTNPNTISGTIWKDSDANGSLTGGETGRFAGVTVVLLDGNGNVVATTSTDANGDYSFANLPDGTFKVDVTDDNNVLNGYWKSTGPSAGSDNNSQLDPYTVSVSGGQTDTTADFGYFQQPAALGNWLWYDDGDGIQESGELPVANWPVTLTITWPNGQTTTLQTTTDANGFYSFANLLQDEDYDGSGSGEPVFTITTPIPTDAVAAPADQGGNDALDSDGTTSGSNVTASVTAGNPLVKGATNPDYDFGFALSPTNLTLSAPEASAVGQTIEVKWQTNSELDILGFSLYRATDLNTAPADRTLLSSQPAKQPGKPFGNTYQYIDTDVQPGVTYTYWLVVQMKDGVWTMDPTTAELPLVEKKIFLPSIRR